MKESIGDIFGKTIRSVIISEENKRRPSTLIFLVFDDDSYYVVDGEFPGAQGVYKGDEEKVIGYAKTLGGKIRVHSPLVPAEGSAAGQEAKVKDLNLPSITRALLDFGDTVPADALFPTVVAEAAEIIARDSYAYCIAACLDRGTKADIIWTIPYDIKNDLGHLDPIKINQMSLDDLADLFARLPRRPRYVNDAPRTVQELTRIVVEECSGDASQIWAGKTAIQVQKTFDSIYGVGPGIASMAVLLIEKAFKVRFEDRENMDIKPDVHTVRVLYRLGVSASMTTESALEASRRMNPEFPGKVDGALWEIGRRWCRPTNPECSACPVNNICKRCT